MPLGATFDPQYQATGRTANQYIQGLDAGASLMDRAQARRLKDAEETRQQAEFQAKMPVLAAAAQADLASAHASVQNAARMEQFRAKAATESKTLNDDYLAAIQLPKFEDQARALSELQPRIAYMDVLPEYKGFVTAVNNATVRAHGAAIATLQLNSRLGSAGLRTFQGMTQGMTDEEKAAAARVQLGLKGRASGAAIQYKEVVGPDGRPILVAVDPRAVGAQVVGGGQRFGTGVDNSQPSVAAGAPGTEVFAGQTAGEKKTQEAEAQRQVDLKKDRPKRQAALAQAEVTSQRLATEIDDLIGKVTVATAGPGGVVLNRFPGTTAKDFEGNLNAIKAVIGFQALQAMRDASPTGGALGQVSDFENKLLQSQLGNLEVGQSPAQLVDNLKKVKQRVVENFGITRAAFSNQYPEEQSAAAPDLKAMSTQQLEQRLQQLRGAP